MVTKRASKGLTLSTLNSYVHNAWSPGFLTKYQYLQNQNYHTEILWKQIMFKNEKFSLILTPILKFLMVVKPTMTILTNAQINQTTTVELRYTVLFCLKGFFSPGLCLENQFFFFWHTTHLLLHLASAGRCEKWSNLRCRRVIELETEHLRRLGVTDLTSPTSSMHNSSTKLKKVTFSCWRKLLEQFDVDYKRVVIAPH